MNIISCMLNTDGGVCFSELPEHVTNDIDWHYIEVYHQNKV